MEEVEAAIDPDAAVEELLGGLALGEVKAIVGFEGAHFGER